MEPGSMQIIALTPVHDIIDDREEEPDLFHAFAGIL